MVRTVPLVSGLPLLHVEATAGAPGFARPTLGLNVFCEPDLKQNLNRAALPDMVISLGLSERVLPEYVFQRLRAYQEPLQRLPSAPTVRAASQPHTKHIPSLFGLCDCAGGRDRTFFAFPRMFDAFFYGRKHSLQGAWCVGWCKKAKLDFLKIDPGDPRDDDARSDGEGEGQLPLLHAAIPLPTPNTPPTRSLQCDQM
ncbi:uncharacterized protein CIMG_12735 [Coccidioides immitis RS]|uniref:Uncharacterized protein n=1 Tax=Coccidioides immitis (strain RS) TaxID=246410 RepID=A0A0D8JS13_COCIM|nr:uncharacterized protein CIMG_12735 [Coccidioides immitis RS]KJF60087.1 hypothetical protein CIMG_12735 [Coccidioides immitis RS]